MGSQKENDAIVIVLAVFDVYIMLLDSRPSRLHKRRHPTIHSISETWKSFQVADYPAEYITHADKSESSAIFEQILTGYFHFHIGLDSIMEDTGTLASLTTLPRLATLNALTFLTRS